MPQTPVLSPLIQWPAIEMLRPPWSLTARTGSTGLISVGGVALREIAAEYGTPPT